MLQTNTPCNSVLFEELAFAIEHTSSRDLSSWGLRSGKQLAFSARRRVYGLGSLVKMVSEAIVGEARALGKAILERRLKAYWECRRKALSIAQRDATRNVKSVSLQLKKYAAADPRSAAVDFAMLVTGFLLGSGGIDGDGGIPDTDLALGIGNHRSIWTHSIVSGVVLETVVLTAVDLVKTVYTNLPNPHDPLWDNAITHSTRLSELFVRSASAGIAYHLSIDATIDGAGKYVDLPVSLSQEGHQTIGGLNAALEGFDSLRKRAPTYGEVVATFSTYGEAAAAAKASRNHKIRSSSTSGKFELVYAPRRT